MENYWMTLRELNLGSMMLRILLAMAMGGVIGFDREQKHRPAGFRTYMLVAVGAAATSILSQYLDTMLNTFWKDAYDIVGRRTDVVRLGARVISGIGFIGTGTILVTERKEVKGQTTACCLWASACMGLACGAGFYECVIIGFILIIIIMKILPLIEREVLAYGRNMNIFIEMDTVENLSEIVNRMKAAGVMLYDVELGKNEPDHDATLTCLFSVRLPKRIHHTELLAQISTLDGVAAIEEI